jgi:hypothetical protein
MRPLGPGTDIALDTRTDSPRLCHLLVFLKQKQKGDVKARSCANRSVQRDHVAKDEVTLPTVTLESVFVTLAIEVRETREVITINIPGVFLHPENEDYIIMRLNGTLAELMAKTDSKLYQKYLSDKKGKKVLYLGLRKALYGMMKVHCSSTESLYQS